MSVATSTRTAAPVFLSEPELRTLTGRARSADQVAALKRMGVPHWINARGKPVVALAALTGASYRPEKPSWEPRRGA